MEHNFVNTYNLPSGTGALGGVNRFASKIPLRQREQAIEWLPGHEAYSLHKQVLLRYPRRKTIVSGPNIQLQADLIDVTSEAEKNDGIHFILSAIDVFSRKAFVRPLRSKHGAGVVRALTEIYEIHPFQHLQTDKGKEFLNSSVKAMCKRLKVNHFTSEDDHTKASIAERFNRTLRGKIFRHFTATMNGEYISSLQSFVDAYNKTVHSATALTPNEVSLENMEDTFIRLYEPDSKPDWAKNSTIKSLQPGDHVRISKTRRAFDRGYTPNWTNEVFVVVKRVRGVTPRAYQIKDLLDEDVAGTFYTQELQKVPKPTEFRIESVIRRKTVNGQRKMLVKWIGYPDKFNEWIAEEQIV